MIWIGGVEFRFYLCPCLNLQVHSFSLRLSPSSSSKDRALLYVVVGRRQQLPLDQIFTCRVGMSQSYPVSHGRHPSHPSFALSTTVRQPSQLVHSKIHVLVCPLKSSGHFPSSSLLPRQFKHYALLVNDYCFEVRGKMGHPAGPAAEKFKYWKRDNDGWNEKKILVGVTDASWDEIVMTCKFSHLWLFILSPIK